MIRIYVCFPGENIIIERTFKEEKLFRTVLFENKKITEKQFVELEILAAKCGKILEKFGLFYPNMIVWLYSDVDICYDRINSRNVERDENNISKEYLKALERKYEILGKSYIDIESRSESINGVKITNNENNGMEYIINLFENFKFFQKN